MLEYGCIMGYLPACFAVMVGSQGLAVGIEHIPELATWSIENLKSSATASFLEEVSLSVHNGGKISSHSRIFVPFCDFSLSLYY